MSKVCISKCVNDARIPVRASYVNLYKWPESDAEFMKSASGVQIQSRVAESISCRQMYLRSYTFSRKETVPERTIKYWGKVRGRTAAGRRHRRKRRCVVVRRVKRRLARCFPEVAVLYYYNGCC